METCIQSSPGTPYRTVRNRSYETTYQREFSKLKRSLTIDEGVPAGQRFPIGSPYNLSDPIGVTSYSIDFSGQRNAQQDTRLRMNTPKTNRSIPCIQLPHWERRPMTVTPVVSEETQQALRNQLNSTYRTDYIGAPQGFPLPLAYNRSRSFWRNRVPHTLDSEYRNSYQQPVRRAPVSIGRYQFSCRVPADAIVPLTLPMWRKNPSNSTYINEISERAPSQLYMKTFVDSLDGPLDQ